MMFTVEKVSAQQMENGDVILCRNQASTTGSTFKLFEIKLNNVTNITFSISIKGTGHIW